MNKKLYEKALNFHKENYVNEKIERHTKMVVEICLDASKNTELNQDIFIIAGWIHDLGRRENEDKHHIISIKYLINFFAKYPEYVPLEREIQDCILNHRTNGQPKTIYGQLFKVADKLSLKKKEYLEWKNQVKKSI